MGITRATDFLGLDATSVPRRELTSWLVVQLRNGVGDGSLPPGTRLPPTRQLADDLGIARGVVVEAYRRLADEALVTARPRTGTLVAHLDPPRPRDGATASSVESRERTVPGRAAARAPVSSEQHAMMGIHTAPHLELNLSPGVPELSHFPRAEWLRSEREVLRSLSADELGYGDPRGSLTLRTELAAWLARTRGLRATADELVIISGVSQALTLTAHVLRRAGADSIGFEDPGSRGARDTFAFWGIRPVGVPVDDHGLDVHALAATPVSAVFVTPAHQYPTGVVLHAERRRALLEWATRVDALIIEDDYDAEHRYDRAPVAALQRYAPGRVVHTGSTSKILAPGLRIGWLVPPAHLMAEFLDVKYASDLGSPVLAQHVLAHLLSTGAYERHQRLARARQRAKRDALVSALRRLAPALHIGGVSAGLHVLVTFPDGAEVATVEDTAIVERLREAGVAVHPLSQHRLAPGPPGLVVGYGAHTPGQLVEAAARIASVLRASGLTSA